MRPMDDQRIGRALRVLRHRRELRQSDVAVAARVSQSLVSDIERGRLAGVTHGSLRRVFAAVDAGFEGTVLWRGPGLDRLLDEDHSLLAGVAADRVSRLWWEVIVEATYAVGREQGSIDVLGALERNRAMVVEEIKTSLVSVESTTRKLDEKARVVRASVGEDRFGWRPIAVGKVLVLPDTSTARRQVQRHAAVLRRVLPARGDEVRAWLRDPVGDIGGILFLPMGDRTQPRAARQRVRPRVAPLPLEP
jgi:transcriptional regulator with XRE-family HTH domain